MFEEERRKCQNGIDSFLTRRMRWMPARIALAVMSWFGFVNLYMTRVNLSVAIVAMVKRNTSGGNVAACVSNTSSKSMLHSNFTNGTFHDVDLGSSVSESAIEGENEEGEFLWDETTQGFVLAAFSCGYACTQIIGGRMAELHGTKMVYGICISGSGALALFSPLAAKIHYSAFIVLRIFQGLLQGASWPSMHACIARWIPPIERPRFVAIVYLAATLSSAMTLPLCSVIIANHGWEAQFYVVGVLSLVWSSVWFSFMHNSPEDHPRISANELEYIQKALRESGTKKSTSKCVPWREIATSIRFWAILFYCIGNTWGIALFSAQLPTYMKNVLGFSIKANGALSALPFLSRYIGGVIWSTMGDWLIARKYLTIQNTRRVFCVTSLLVPGILVLGVSYTGCDAKLTVGLFCLALFCNGSMTTSGLVNHTDIAPNFAGTLLGIDNTLASMIAFTVPVVTGFITKGQQTLEAWQKVFWICSPLYMVMGVLFIAFVSGEVQPWNDIDLVKASSKKHKPSDSQGIEEEASLEEAK